jgi:predicted Zn-dependent protease
VTRGRRVAVLMLTVSLTAGCATPSGPGGSATALKPGQRPEAKSDEAGLWMQMDRVEAEIVASPAVVHDRALTEYVDGIVHRLAGPQHPGIRVYVIRNAEFNASMAPNGMLQVWTGLFLRTANEAQLAYVLGHELAHYLRRHSLQLWQNVTTKSATLEVIGMVLTGGAAGKGMQMAALGSAAAFSRDNEREADEVGFELMVKAGYDPREAARSWDRLLAETATRSGQRQPTIFFATHPSTAERVATLQERSAKTTPTATELRIGREEYLAAVRPLRRRLLNDEVHRRQFAASEVLLRELLQDGDGLGVVNFAVGELHRLRGDADDAPKAIEAYRRALTYPDAPPETDRNLGQVLLRSGDRSAARDALSRYLERNPNAEDRELIKSQLSDQVR